MLIAVVVIWWLGCAIFAGMIAQAKGLPAVAWTVAGLIFGVVALLAVGFMPASRDT